MTAGERASKYCKPIRCGSSKTNNAPAIGKPKKPPIAAPQAVRLITRAERTDCFVLRAMNDPNILDANTRGISGPSDNPEAIPNVDSMTTWPNMEWSMIPTRCNDSIHSFCPGMGFSTKEAVIYDRICR